MEYAVELNAMEFRLCMLSRRLLRLVKVAITAIFLLCLYTGCLFQGKTLEVPGKTRSALNENTVVTPIIKIAEMKFDISNEINLHNPIHLMPSIAPFIRILEKEHISSEISVAVPVDAVREEHIIPDLVPERIPNAKPDDKEDAKDDTVENIPVYPTIRLHGNGGDPELTELKLDSYVGDSKSFPIPIRLGKVFAGWYMDTACTIPYEKVEEGSEIVDLYACWREFPGFLSDDQGMLTGYTDIEAVTFDGVLAFPTNMGCKGALADAFKGIEGLVMEIYIPANVVCLPTGIFDGFYNLIYIEVHKDNPVFNSEFGVLYAEDGTLFCYPEGR